MDPRSVHNELVAEIKEELLFVAGYPATEIGDVFERLSEYFQALGICHILETADPDQFRENLVRSGYARRYFLNNSREQGHTNDRHLALSRTEAFLDSLAAGQLTLAREIAELSIEKWESTWEYEDDFCFFHFLHQITRAPDDLKNPILRGTLSRFEAALEGGESLRLDACNALLRRKAEECETAISGLMEEREESLNGRRERMLERDISVCAFWPRSFVSIEGLALLRIADLLGIHVEGDVPLCPEVARLGLTDRSYQDIFLEIELARPRT
jgi:hypothetical protein